MVCFDFTLVKTVTFSSHHWLSVHPLLCRQSHESNFSLQMFLPCSSYSALVTHILLTNTSVFDRAHPPSHACVTGLKRRSWTDFFLGWAVCFPTSDYVIFSRGLFFFLLKWKFESENSQEYQHMIWNGGNKQPKVHRSISQKVQSIYKLRWNSKRFLQLPKSAM